MIKISLIDKSNSYQIITHTKNGIIYINKINTNLYKHIKKGYINKTDKLICDNDLKRETIISKYIVLNVSCQIKIECKIILICNEYK